MSSVQEDKPPTENTKTRIQDIRNADLVSRLLAATPPYLYSALPLQPHAFFFSEMLRSFVQARHCRGLPPQHARRFKRRPHKYFAGDDKTEWQRSCDWTTKLEEEKREVEETHTRPDGPLELTVDKQRRTYSPRRSPKPDRPKSPGSPGPPPRPGSFVDVGTEESLAKPLPCVGRIIPPDPAGVTPSNLILPPPPPMWYPPLYTPPFGVDPLNFFIDLRVSGHIYDKKRAEALAEAQENRQEEGGDRRPLVRDMGLRQRHPSAFSVPVRSMAPEEKIYEKNPALMPGANGTTYVMRNLKKIYSSVKDVGNQDRDNNGNERDTKAEISDLTDDEVTIQN